MSMVVPAGSPAAMFHTPPTETYSPVDGCMVAVPNPLSGAMVSAGTPPKAAPEQASTARTTTARIDMSTSLDEARALRVHGPDPRPSLHDLNIPAPASRAIGIWH